MKRFRNKDTEKDFYDQVTIPLIRSLLPFIFAFCALVVSLIGLYMLKKSRKKTASSDYSEPVGKKVIVYKKGSLR